MPRGKGKKKKQEETKKLNVTVTVLLVISVLSAVLIYTKQGKVGQTLAPVLGGVLGYIKYLLPIGLGAIAIYIAHEKDTKYYSKKLLMFLIILALIDCVFSCSQISKGEIDISSDFNSILARAYELGKVDKGGGVLGTAIAIPLVNMLGTTGTVIASLGLILVLIVFIFSLHPAEAISKSIDKMEQRKAERQKYKKERVIREDAIEIEPQEKWKDKKNKKVEDLDEQITINLNDIQKNANAKSGSTIDVPNFNTSSKRGLVSKFTKAKNFKISDMDVEESAPKVESTQVDEENNSENEGLFAQKEVEKETKTKEVLQLQHTLTEAEINYEFPPMELMQKGSGNDAVSSRKALLAVAEKLRKTLYSFGVSAKVENVSVGPAITRYELAPAEGVRVSKIANLADDIALSLEAETIRIEAPIPGKHTVGIEVPNKAKSVVALRDIIESDKFIDSESKLAFALGKDVAGEEIVTDIAKMPHLLIAGSTGSGKSVCINTMITSIIYKAKPSDVKLLMVDPKVVELSVYNGIPHLLIPVVTDPKKAAGALEWAVQEMVKRYSLFAEKKVRDIKGYNEYAENAGEPKMHQIVIIIDELADLMMVAAKEVEDAICRLAQMARAAGMHLVIATQRPSVDVITGIIKANIPSRIAFAVSSQIDSRTILDSAGAEKLLGKGDMLFYPSGAPKPVRIQGAFISDKEVENIVKFIRNEGEAIYDENIIEKIESVNEPEKASKGGEEDDDGTDALLDDAIEICIETQQASTSFIQRRLKVGYARAGRIIDQMEQRGIISGYQGSKPREVLMSRERWHELKMAPTTGGQNDEESVGK